MQIISKNRSNHGGEPNRAKNRGENFCGQALFLEIFCTTQKINLSIDHSTGEIQTNP
jgi:hypothetical protein